MKKASLVCAGWNGFGQLGVGDLEFRDTAVDVFLESESDIERVRAGGLHFAGFSFALCQDGSVYGWGDNSFGQLFLEKNTPTSTPTKLVTPAPVIDVACGTRHTVLVLKDGSVKAAGDDSFGQMPSEDVADVQLASCGDAHTLLLLRDGSLRGFGSNRFGQLGGLSQINVSAVACGQSHSLLLLSSGRIMAMGANTHGQIGVPEAPERVTEPLLVGSDTLVCSAIAAGHFHSLGLTRHSLQCYGWGSNEQGQLNQDPEKESERPQGPVPVRSDFAVKCMSAGGFHTLLIGHHDGTVWSCGCSSENQQRYSGQAVACAAAETHSVFLTN